MEVRFDALKRCVDIANEETCELFVVRRDLFDRVSVAKRDIQRAASILAEFQGRLVAVLPGNPDYITQWPDALYPFQVKRLLSIRLLFYRYFSLLSQL